MTSILQSRAAMEATALIDQIRHESLALQRYLSIDEQRKELGEALTEFYQRQGVTDVTPEMIEAGVQAYQRDRFTYRGFQGGALAQAVAKGYIGLSTNFRVFAIIATTAIVFPIGLSLTSAQMREAQYATLVKDINSSKSAFDSSTASLKGYVDDQQSWREQVRKSGIKPQWAVDAAESLLVAHGQLLSLVESRLYQLATLQDAGAQVTLDQVKGGYEQYKSAYDSKVAKREPILKSLRADIEKLQGYQVSLTELLAADQALTTLMSSRSYQEFSADPTVQYGLVEIKGALSTGKAAEASKGMDKLKSILEARGAAKALQASYAVLSAQYATTFKDAEGRRRADLLLSQAQKAVEVGNNAGYSAASKQLTSLAQYVASDLSIRATNGRTSGAIKEPSKGGAYRYYVILQAVDASGRAVAREVYDQEKQTNRVVSEWGQEVTNSAFESMKADKKRNGFVSDADFGRKYPGNYTLSFKKQVLKGTITSW